MIGYKDMTFCPFYSSCTKGAECERAKTQAVIDAAWKCGMSIMEFMHHPDCHEENENG